MLVPPSVRSLVPLALVIAWAGCFSGVSELRAADDEDPAEPAPGLGACQLDEDCVPAASTCCECPTFATNLGDPKTRVCDDVDCPPASCPDNVEARCNLAVGACELVCKPLACDLACDQGFALDANGCLSCACAPPVSAPDACTVDGDCVRTRADCCGCENGGDDTAVLASELAGFDAMLMCRDVPQCPGVDTCDVTRSPRCVQGRCELLADVPPGACGRPDLPACAPTEACTVNANDQANLYGVGICLPR